MFGLSLLVAVGASVIFFTAASPVNSVREGINSDAISRLLNRITQLNGECLNCLNELNPRTSQATAIPSLINTLAQLAIEANGSTYDELMNFIGLRERNEIRAIVPVFDEYRMQKNVEFDLVVFTDTTNTFCTEFKETYNDYFGGEAKSIDLSNPKKAANYLNDWVSSKSFRNNDVITSKQLCEDTSLIFIGFNKFAVIWDDSFIPSRTVTSEFYKNKDEKTKISALYGSGEVKLAENAYLDAKVIEIKLTGWSLIIFYPNEIDGLSSIIAKCRDPKVFTDAISNEEKPVTRSLIIPLSEVIATVDFEAAFKMYNMLPQIFDPKLSELNALCNKKNDFVSSISQQIHLIFNQGIEESDTDDCTDSNTDKLVLRHPFSYYIVGTDGTPYISGMQYGD